MYLKVKLTTNKYLFNINCKVILHHNPQLSEEEFEKELESDNKIKKFYYTYED
jgi:hypothetical protein